MNCQIEYRCQENQKPKSPFLSFIDIYYRILHIVYLVYNEIFYLFHILKLSKVLRNIILYTMR